jgi:hypothetical protein
MPVDSFYRNATPNVGAPIAGSFLREYFATIKGMNDAARASDGEDAGDLAKLEAEARARVGQLASALADVRNGDTRSYNDLRKAYLQATSAEEQEAIRANAVMGKARLDTYLSMREQAVREAKKLGKEVEYSDEASEKIRNFGSNYNESPETAARKAEALFQAERAGNMNDPKRDRMAADLVASLRRSKGDAYADAVASELGYDEDPAIYFAQVHAPTTTEAAEESAQDYIRRSGGGARTRGGARAALGDMGIDPTELEADGESVSVSTRTRTPSGSPTVTGASIKAKGLSGPALTALASGEDPYKALQDAILAQQKYADDLARRRESASRKSRYPSPNEYTVSPNRISWMPDPEKAPDVWMPDPEFGDATHDTVITPGTDLVRDWRSQVEPGGPGDDPTPIREQPRLPPQSLKGTVFEPKPGRAGEIEEAIGPSEFEEFDAFLSADPALDEFDAFLKADKLTTDGKETKK